MSIIEEYRKVKEFHRKFNHPVADSPTQMDTNRAAARYEWMLEELNEFIESATLVDQADAMIDLIYFALGTLVEMGVQPAKIFTIVHKANMNKLWGDGKPHYNEQGKTIKPESWQDPFQLIEDEISKQNKVHKIVIAKPD